MLNRLLPEFLHQERSQGHPDLSKSTIMLKQFSALNLKFSWLQFLFKKKLFLAQYIRTYLVISIGRGKCFLKEN